MKSHVRLAGHLVLSLLLLVNAAASSNRPQVRTKNGTYVGRRLPGYNQDAFLGMHYALSTEGPRRFMRPHYINESWTGDKPALNYTSAVSLLLLVLRKVITADEISGY